MHCNSTVQCGQEEGIFHGQEVGIFRGKKGLHTRQTEAMFMKKRKLQSYMPTNWHNVSKLHTWSEIGIKFKSYITTNWYIYIYNLYIYIIIIIYIYIYNVSISGTWSCPK